MSDLREFFEERKNEVNIYFEFINPIGIDNSRNKTIKYDSQNKLTTTNELKQVLKSNGIMILYNLIEGVVSKSLEEIIDCINDQEIKYCDLKPGFKRIILKSTSKKTTKDFEEKNIDLVNFIDSICQEVFNLELNQDNKKILSGGGGNIDAKYIRDNIAKKLHIRFSRNEDCLVTIKNDRNHLAHGSKSYITCSQNKTLNEIKKQKTKVFKYLNHYVNAIDKYVDTEQYKK